MEITSGQQYNVREKPTVTLHTRKAVKCSTPSHMVVIIYYYIGLKYKATTWYLTGFPNGSNLGSTV